MDRLDVLHPPKGIRRHDYSRTRGWLARIYWSEDGQEQCARKLFSDGVYGGELAALGAAVLWQREQRELHERPPRERKRRPGYGYVQETTRRYRTAAGELRSYPAMEAWFWGSDGRPQSTSWSIEVHGPAQARERCESWLDRLRSELGDGERVVELAAAG